MNEDPKITDILTRLGREEISAEDAKKQLVAAGLHPADADDLVFIGQGGSDVIGPLPGSDAL